MIGPDEALAAEQGTGRLAVTAFDRAGKTAAFFSVTGPSVERAVAFWDGQAWHREPIDVPPEAQKPDSRCSASPRPRRATRGWSRARIHPPAAACRCSSASPTAGPRWQERSLGDSPFAQRADANLGLEEVEPLGDAAQPITVTEQGVWLDGRFLATAESGALHTFTLYFDQGAGRVTGTLVRRGRHIRAAPSAAIRLDARLSTQTAVGYRSFAWGGDGFGTRVITNPLEPGGNGETNRGTYLRFEGTTFERMPGGGGNFHPGGAFSSVDEGWLEGPFHVTRTPEPVRIGQLVAGVRARPADLGRARAGRHAG